MLDYFLSKYPSQILRKAENIQLVVTDVDGVLTEGGLTYHDDGGESKVFNVKDGTGFAILHIGGIKTGVITARSSEAVKRRCMELEIEFQYHGAGDKKSALEQLFQATGFSYHNTAYIGDDLNDGQLLENCALGAVPSDAHFYAKELADLVLEQKGGKGAFREFADLVLYARGSLKNAVEKYLE